MSQQIIIQNDAGIYLFSWTEGLKKAELPKSNRTDDSVLAQALWLERHGFSEEAEQLLDDWLDTSCIVRMVGALGASAKG